MAWYLQGQTLTMHCQTFPSNHDDVIKWKLFPRYWPFVRGIHRFRWIPYTKGQWRGALMFSLICVWINGWVNNHEAGDLRRYPVHYVIIVMFCCQTTLYGCHGCPTCQAVKFDFILNSTFFSRENLKCEANCSIWLSDLSSELKNKCQTMTLQWETLVPRHLPNIYIDVIWAF